MRHFLILSSKIVLIGLWAYAALPVNHVLAQGINEPRVIGDARLASCVNRLGQMMSKDGAAKVPFTLKIQTSAEAVSSQKAKIVGDTTTAACIDLLAQDLVANGTARVPFVIRAMPTR
jgi:hypothetical protein